MPTIMEILRHTRISQTRRYVKGRSHLPKDATRRREDAFVPTPKPATGTRTETETENRRATRARHLRRMR
ncbi:hypothetical protein GCM10027162_01540 [Streptomyces incanus]